VPTPPSVEQGAAPGVSSGIQALVAAVAPSSNVASIPEDSSSSIQKVAAAPEPGGRRKFQDVKLISAPPPVFPLFAKQQHLHGVVGLEAAVDERGLVTKVTILRGNPVLAAAAKSAVLKWRYEPATLDGRPVEHNVSIAITFESNQK